MSISKKVSLILYRFREKGLEIFLVNDRQDGQDESWSIPEGVMNAIDKRIDEDQDRLIELDPVEEGGDRREALAVECDWHEIPSLKTMLIEDAEKLKSRIKAMDEGTYFRLKEALKKVMPHQYKFLKELKDILTDRNSVRDL